MKIKCTTLFDITQTRTNARRHTLDTPDGKDDYVKRKNQQSNFDALIQIISIRSQPEQITAPEKTMVSLKVMNWGTDITSTSKVPMWEFTFEVDKEDVFQNDKSPIGNLFDDCAGVPMITRLEEFANIGIILQTGDDARNINFEIVNEANTNN